MNCRTFRASHADFVDALAPEHVRVGLQAHLATCPQCARFDVVMRRGLLVVRNLPAVEAPRSLTRSLLRRIDALSGQRLTSSSPSVRARRRTLTSDSRLHASPKRPDAPISRRPARAAVSLGR